MTELVRLLKLSRHFNATKRAEVILNAVISAPKGNEKGMHSCIPFLLDLIRMITDIAAERANPCHGA